MLWAIGFFLGMPYLGWTYPPASYASFQWFKKYMPLSLIGKLSRKKTVSVFRTGPGSNTH